MASVAHPSDQVTEPVPVVRADTAPLPAVRDTLSAAPAATASRTAARAAGEQGRSTGPRPPDGLPLAGTFAALVCTALLLASLRAWHGPLHVLVWAGLGVASAAVARLAADLPSRLLRVSAVLVCAATTAVAVGAVAGSLARPSADAARAPDAAARPGTSTQASPGAVPGPSSRPSSEPLSGSSQAAAAGAGGAVTAVPLGAAGSVVLRVEGGRVVVGSVSPSSGWRVERAEDHGGRLDLRLTDGRSRVRVEASVVDGAVSARVRND